MQRRFLTAALSVLALLAASAGGFAQDKQPAVKKPKADTAYVPDKPGKEHAQLRRLVGRWNCDVKNFFPDPSKPTTSKGTSVMFPLLGGRFVQQQFNSTMMGAPFQGIGINGYDSSTKKYVGTWVDNHSNGIMTTEGTYDVKTQTLTQTGTSSSPMGPMKFKMTSKYLSNDKFVFTMYMVAGTSEQKMMEITYTRMPGKPKKGKKRD